MKYKFVVVGAGTAGIITSTYLKQYWGDNAEVVLIYDHSKPGIGVGESLTPKIYEYLDYVGVTRDELVANVNATVKLGLRFENWLNDSKYFYHSFVEHADIVDPGNLGAGFDIANNIFDSDVCYSSIYHENSLIPANPSASQALHIDAVLFSKYIENKFKDRLTIIDDEVIDVKLKIDRSGEIDKLILRNLGEYSGDFYIDATGFQSALFKRLNTKWVDMTEWLPIDRCIPNPISWDFKEQPTFTTSEASKDGWILQVPLSNRWGAGYLYSSEFTTDEQAFERFSTFVKNKYKKDLTNTAKSLSFKSGYWENQWVGNCLAVGLASGFAEPLEATNIHHTVYQTKEFIDMFNFTVHKSDKDRYNTHMQRFYKNAYTYLRFCYSTGRSDSEFWKYMTNSIPQPVSDLISKVKTDLLNNSTCPGLIFNFRNFTKVAHGLKLTDSKNYRNILEKRNLYEHAKMCSEKINTRNMKILNSAVSHKAYIDSILKG